MGERGGGRYLVVMDNEEKIHFLDYDFVVIVLNKFGFGNNFIPWLKLLLNSQQSCVMTQY